MSILFRTSGAVKGPEFFLKRGGGGVRSVRMPVTVAIIERPDGLVLVDAGWSRLTCAWPERDPGRAKSFFLGLDVKPEDAIASQLLSLGYAPGDVKHIVATHLHIDHIGGAVDFPSATVHCSSREAEACARGALSGYDVRTLHLRNLEPRPVDGPPMLGFEASRDLFDDGSVLLLDAKGHTSGSMAVAVKLAEGWCLHAGDSTMFVDDFHDDSSKPPSLYMRALAWDVATQRRTYGALLEAEEKHAAKVVPSHDLAVYESLPHQREDAWPCAWTRSKGKSQKPRKGA